MPIANFITLVNRSNRKSFLAAFLVVALQITNSFAASFPSSGPITPGSEARLRGTVALAPNNAPLSVKRAIWAANQLRTKPYRYGGGHKSFQDTGYDCSGTISYALAGAGLVGAPL